MQSRSSNPSNKTSNSGDDAGTGRDLPSLERPYFVHESTYVDAPCTIGRGTKIWHFSHIMAGLRHRRALQHRPERRDFARLHRGEQRQDPEQRVHVYGRGAGGRCLLRSLNGVHERPQSAQPRSSQGRVPQDSGAPRRDDRRQCDDRLRRHARAVLLCRCRFRRDPRRAGLCDGLRQSGQAPRLDVQLRRKAHWTWERC